MNRNNPFVLNLRYLIRMLDIELYVYSEIEYKSHFKMY